MEKTGIINKHLEAIEFNKGTYIRIQTDPNPDREIREFKEDLKACYKNILNTDDAYTEERFEHVQRILNRFRSNENREIEWTNKVTDVRQWFVFNASERFRADDEEKEFYAGTSGKSGGQKEKLVIKRFRLPSKFPQWKFTYVLPAKRANWMLCYRHRLSAPKKRALKKV